MAYKLDAEHATTLQISNDAFWYLYQEEEMLDEDNMEEAIEIMNMFPNGYIIKDDYKFVEDEDDLIECTFIPYVKDIDIKWDGEYVDNPKGPRNDVVLFKVIDHEHCYMRWFFEHDGRIIKEGQFYVVYYLGNPWCKLPSMDPNMKQCTEIPLWGKRVKYFTTNRF